MHARSQALVEKKTAGGLTFTTGDIRDIRLNQRFDVVIALFHVISYQTTNDDVTAAFQTARQHLNPGGIFIFDVWYGPAVLTERPRSASNEWRMIKPGSPAWPNRFFIPMKTGWM